MPWIDRHNSAACQLPPKSGRLQVGFSLRAIGSGRFHLRVHQVQHSIAVGRRKNMYEKGIEETAIKGFP